MVAFQDIQDVEEWLEPLDYIAFWEAIAPYALGVDDRDRCDGLIAGGVFTAERLLAMLKALTVMQLSMALDLRHRSSVPPVAKYITSVH